MTYEDILTECGGSRGHPKGRSPAGCPRDPTHEVEYPIRTSTDDSIIISFREARSADPSAISAKRNICRMREAPRGMLVTYTPAVYVNHPAHALIRDPAIVPGRPSNEKKCL